TQALSRVVAGAEPMSKKRYASVWDAIEDTPVEAENMKLRSALMIAIREHIKGKDWTQAEAAKRLKVTQQLVADLMRGNIDLFRPRRAGQNGNLRRPEGAEAHTRRAVRAMHEAAADLRCYGPRALRDFCRFRL